MIRQLRRIAQIFGRQTRMIVPAKSVLGCMLLEEGNCLIWAAMFHYHLCRMEALDQNHSRNFLRQAINPEEELQIPHQITFRSMLKMGITITAPAICNTKRVSVSWVYHLVGWLLRVIQHR